MKFLLGVLVVVNSFCLLSVCEICVSYRAFSYIHYINQQMHSIKYNSLCLRVSGKGVQSYGHLDWLVGRMYPRFNRLAEDCWSIH